MLRAKNTQNDTITVLITIQSGICSRNASTWKISRE